MPDEFQAESPRWSSERPSAYPYSEVNLRKPDSDGSNWRWVIIAAVLVFGLVGFLGLVLAYLVL